MQNLLTHFLENGIPPDEISQIVEAFKFKEIPKSGYFVEEGKTSKHLRNKKQKKRSARLNIWNKYL